MFILKYQDAVARVLFSLWEKEMPSRILKIVSFLVIVGVVSWVFYFNPGSVVVTLGPGKTLSAPMALILIFVFCFGALCTASIALFIGTRYQFQRWRESRGIKLNKTHEHWMVSGREQLAAGNYQGARDAFLRIVEQDQGNIVARIMLASTFVAQGQIKQALQVLEECRSEQKNNIELLFLAAQVNAELGNSTAAYDNIALVLRAKPDNPTALERMVFYSANLERFGDAIDYQQRLLRQTTDEDLRRKRQEKLAELEVSAARKACESDDAALRAALEDLRRKYRDFTCVLAELAELERRASRIDAAVSHWSRMYQLSGEPRCLIEIASTWLTAEEPEKALAAVRSALSLRTAESVSPVRGRLFLVSLLLHLEMREDARREIEALRAREDLDLGTKRESSVLEAKLLCREGRFDEASQILLTLAEESLLASDMKRLKPEQFDTWDAQPWHHGVKLAAAARKQPSPRLSTP